MPYRLIAVDLDGTLLDSNWRISSETLTALDQARTKGLQVVIVTGRHHVAAYPYHRELNLDTPAICCNGAYLYDYCQRKVLSANPLAKQQALKLLAVAGQYEVHCLVYTEDAMVFEQENEHVSSLMAWAARLPSAVRPDIRWVKSLGTVIEDEELLWKVVVSHSSLDVLKACLSQMKQDLTLNYEWSWHDRVDIVQTGNNKGDRLAEWAKSQGIEPSEIIAFGDSDNDVSMLTQVGLGIAMQGSEDAVKAYADWVTGSNNNDGIAQALRRFVL